MRLCRRPIPGPPPSWSQTLDDPTTTPPPTASTGRRKQPPGLRAQLVATRDAAIALVQAHIDLAKTEMSAVAGEIGRIAALAAVALVVVILAGLLGTIGLALFLGEWLLGSLGWGVLDGILAFSGIALTAGLLAAGVSGRRIVRSFVVAVVVAVVVGVALGAVAFGAQVGAALGITIGYVAWIALMGVEVARTGIDIDGFKERFYPSQTIDTGKETLEWLQKRMPPGIGS